MYLYRRRDDMKLFTTITIVAISAHSFADTFLVIANGSSWAPDKVHVIPGDVLRFEYGTGYPHTITSGSNCIADEIYFNESLNSTGDYYEWTVPKGTPSEIPFFCDPHCDNGMEGVIFVEGGTDPLVDLNIGIVDIDCYFNYTKNTDGQVQVHFSELWNDKVSRASFAWGMEVGAEEDVVIQVSAAINDSGELFAHRASDGSETALVTGPMTLYAGEKYLFHGSCNFYGEYSLDLEWTEEYAGDEETFVIVEVVGDGSLNVTDDNFFLRASRDQWATFTFRALEDLEMPVSVVADVSSPTLTMPASGTEANVSVTAGYHSINVGGGMSGNPGVLMLNFDSGDDGGSGELPQDVNGDCVVDVGDLLEIISAWGSTCP
jgi:plastocyanin